MQYMMWHHLKVSFSMKITACEDIDQFKLMNKFGHFVAEKIVF